MTKVKTIMLFFKAMDNKKEDPSMSHSADQENNNQGNLSISSTPRSESISKKYTRSKNI